MRVLRVAAGIIRPVKKIIIALVASGGLVVGAGCGGGTGSAAPTPTASRSSSKPTASPTPVPVELTRADIAQKIQAALKKQGSYRMTITLLIGQDDHLTVTVRSTGATEDFALNGADGSVIGVGGQYYYKDGPLSGKSGKWTKYDPKARGSKASTNRLILIYRSLVQAHLLLGGAQYSSQFDISGGPPVGQVETTRYVLLIDLKKAAADKKLSGAFLSAEATDDKTLPMSALVDSDGRLRRLDYGTGENAISIDYTDFGTKAVITAPSKQQLAN